jgi:hypothetical protein
LFACFCIRPFTCIAQVGGDIQALPAGEESDAYVKIEKKKAPEEDENKDEGKDQTKGNEGGKEEK